MFNLLSLFKRKPRIIPFYTLSDDEKNILEKHRQLTPENKCKVLSFKYHNGNLTSPHLAAGYKPPVKPPGKYNIVSFEYRNFEY